MRIHIIGGPGSGKTTLFQKHNHDIIEPRKEHKKWTYDAFEGDDEVELASLGIRFPVVDAYEDVIFENDKKATI